MNAELIGLFVAVTGLVLGILVLAFTGQRAEMTDNLAYTMNRLAAQVRRRFGRGRAAVSGLVPGDKAKFVRDVSIPDGTRVLAGTQFAKIWEIENVGIVVWENRFLQRGGPAAGAGRLRSAERIRIPYTKPGQRVRIRITLVAPDEPGSCYAEWKMVDERGRYLMPTEGPLFVSVDVVESLSQY